MLDKEKDDVITVRELKYFMRKVANIKVSTVEAEAMIKFAGLKGKITREQFQELFELPEFGFVKNDPKES